MILLPSDNGCYVCGVMNKKGFNNPFYVDGDFVVAFFEGSIDYKGHGPIHGGVPAALLDEAMGLGVTYSKKILCVTAEITIRYLKPLHINGSYTVRGRMVKDRKLLCEAYGEIIDHEHNRYVKAFGKYVPLTKAQSCELYPDVFTDHFGNSK
ncbi:MAG TPA: hypothetical protein DEF36_09635 [Desulfotomaculum sp.]|nr:hypothetical protein [Desulfotomaculum sp.]